MVVVPCAMVNGWRRGRWRSRSLSCISVSSIVSTRQPHAGEVNGVWPAIGMVKKNNLLTGVHARRQCAGVAVQRRQAVIGHVFRHRVKMTMALAHDDRDEVRPVAATKHAPFDGERRRLGGDSLKTLHTQREA